MSVLCPITKGLDKDERFQEFKKAYRDRSYSDYELMMLLQTYRELYDKDIDWYPSEVEEYKEFTNYLDNPSAENKKPGVTKESLDNLYKTLTVKFSPSKLDNRLDRIAYIFSDYVSNLVKKSSFGVTRQQAIRNQATKNKNGFNVILEKVFDYIHRLSSVDAQIAWYRHSFPNATDAEIEVQRENLTKRAEEFALMDECRESLATLAALRIGAREGFAVNIDGLEYNFADLENMEDTEDDGKDSGVDSGEAMKGDRYEDYRTFTLSSTLSTEARLLLEKMYQMDDAGNVITDDLMYPMHVNMRQAIISLHKALQTAKPDTLITKLQQASKRYPWMRSLIKHLSENPDDRQLVYTTFKRARNTYFYGYKDKAGRLVVTASNKVANGSSLSKEAGTNISSGILTNEKLSLVDKNGNFKEDSVLSEIKKTIESVRKFSNTNFEVKPVSNAAQYRKWATEDAANDWKVQVESKPVEDFEELSQLLRGLGFTLSAGEVKTALADSAPISSITGTRKEKYGDVTPQTSALDRLVSSIDEIYKRAEYLITADDDLTGSHLYNYAQDEFSNIANVLSTIQRGETEERTISGKKSLATATTPNALHELVEKLSNAEGLSDPEYREMLMQDYGRFEGMGLGFGDAVSLTGWLKDLYNDGKEGSDASYKTLRNSFQVVDFTDFKDIVQKEFADLTAAEHAAISYVMYIRGTQNRTSGLQGALYEVPIQADYETAYNFLAASRYTVDELVERFAQEVECEAQRIAAIKERQAKDPKESGADPIRPVANVYEHRGLEFQIFPELNNNGFIEEYSSAEAGQAHDVVVRYVRTQLETLLVDEKRKLKDMGFFKKSNRKLAGIKNDTDKNVDDWILNAAYARQQITKLLYGGLEHFKSTTDAEKRNMYAHAMRLPMYTEATYRGEKVGRENQRVLYLADEEARSAVYEQIAAVADKLEAQKKITPAQSAQMKKAYESITTTDGQGLRTLDSARAVKIMSSTWTDSDEVAYQHIKSRNYGPSDVQHFMIGIKPVYTGYEILPAQEGKYQKPVRVPVLHKYSEMILLPEMLESAGVQNATAPLRALNKINDKLGKGNEIDLFIFGSGVKIGAHSVIDAFAKDKEGNRILKDSDAIADFVDSKLKAGSFWIHTLPYKYYGITSSMHADVLDKKIAWATQAEKEAWGNIQSGETITVNGKQMPAKDARSLFYKIKAARTVDTYKRLTQQFANKREVAKILKEELANKSYQPRDLIFALQMRDNGTFSYPLYSPSIKHDVVALLSSVVKKRFTKVPTKGANMTQTTSFGLDAAADGQGFADNLPNGFSPLEVKFDKNGNFLYVEVYLPVYDSNLTQFTDENGNITPARLNELVRDGYIPESILNFIAYRTPSDAEHSVIPCRVKGFISNVAGPSIRFPQEIMKMTGHDYDGDKVRCHFKEFTIGWNYKQIDKDYERLVNVEGIQAIFSNDDPTLTPKEVFRRNATSDTNPDSKKYRAIVEVKYDYSKSPIENIKNPGDYRALNNALVDLMFAQLTSENGGLKMFIPGGCEETKHYANAIGTRQEAKNVITPFAVTHATESHGYMMEGAGMIGVYALYNSTGSMFQRLNLGYVPRTDKDGNAVPVILFGQEIGELFPVLSNGSFTTLGESRLLNAAVDNGKDPLLGYLNQTEGLSHLTNFLLSAKVSEANVHLLMNQPVMKELANRIKSSGMQFANVASDLQDEIKTKLSEGAAGTTPYMMQEGVAKVSQMTKESCLENLDKSYQSIVEDKAALRNQLYILQTMQWLNPAARDLEEFTKLMRPEADRGGIDSSIGGTIARLMQLEKFRERLADDSENPINIYGVKDVISYRDVQTNSMTDKMLLDSFGDELPEVVALNSLMKDSIYDLLNQYFPEARNSWLGVIKRITDKYSYDRIPGSVVENLVSDMILWKLLSNSTFITGNPQEEQTRIIKEVPENLRSLKRRIETAKENPGEDKVADALVNNIFLNNLDLGTTIGSENEQISRIRFQLNGSSIEDTADRIRSDWNYMLVSGDADVAQLAKDLFKYNLYTNGFSFGRYEFAHFAPASIIFSTPGYLNALNSVLESDWAGDEEDQFYHQYVRNHWGDSKLLSRYTPDKIPMNLRTQLGYELPVQSPVKPEVFNAALANADYIILRKSVEGKVTDELYQLIKDSRGDIMSLEPAKKLGIRNRSNQVIKQYNPKVRDYRQVNPVFISNSVAWEGRGAVDEIPPKDTENDDETARQNAIDEIPFAIPIPGITADVVKKEEKEIEKAAKENNGKLTTEQAVLLPGFEDELPVQSKEEINIYAGTGENAELSNFAYRPFVYRSYRAGVENGATIKFNTVEGAFQAQKLNYTSAYSADEIEQIENKLANATGKEARSIGRSIKGLDIRKWDSVSSQTMYSLLYESFRQNPEAVQKLFATGNATLTHKQDTGKWRTEFPKLLMRVRDNLRQEQNTKQGSVRKIISGGQTGVDTIGLQVAKKLGIQTGGTAPKGYLRESGIDNEDIRSYGLVEISEAEQSNYTKRKGKTDPYTARTELNVRNSDGTVYFSTNADSAGLQATRRAATEFNKPFLLNPTSEQLAAWIKDNNISVLNVAGNRGSKLNNGNEISNILEKALTNSTSDQQNNKMFCLVSRDNAGNIVSGYYEATPAVVEQARAQQAFLDLNKRLRKILADYGIRVGALEESEAKLMAGGVTDFSAAKVLVEGMVELIRIANGDIGEYALPEEFAHVAIEMLGGHTVTRDEFGNITSFKHENALVTRLLNELNKNDRALEEAYDGQLDAYKQAYGENNREKLIMEAAGKLVAKQLFQQQYIKTPSARNLVQRVCDAIKAFFKNLSIRRLYDALFGAEHVASQLARDLLSGRLADEMSLDKITTSEEYLKIDKDLSDKQDILSKMRKTILREIDILERRVKYSKGKGATSSSLDAAKRQLDKLNATAEKQKLETTVVDYLKDTMNFMTEMEKSVDAVINNRPANAVCRKLRIVKDTMYGFASVIADVNAALEAGELQDDVELEETIAKITRQAAKFWNKYDRISMMYFEQFLSSVYGKDGVTLTVGKNKGKTLTIHDMARRANGDINIASRWLDAVSDSGDYVLMAVDDVTRNAKINARTRVNQLRPELEAAMSNLIKEQGNRDQTFMFEYKTIGKKRIRTGRYISEEESENLSPAQKEFYDVFMRLKEEADRCMPSVLVSLRKMIMFRKQHYEKMREAQGLRGIAGEEWESAKRSILEMGDIDYENEEVIKDFEGNIVDQLPIKFLNKGKSETYDDMTEDAASSLMAYCGMAFEYQEMNNVIGLIENARYMSSKRDVVKKKTFRNLITRVGDEKGFHYQEPYTVKQAETAIQGMMDDYIRMHVYGHLQKDEGTVGNTRISKRKLTNALTGYTSLAQMALNIHQRIANVNTGMTQIVVEVAGGEISFKDVAWASAIWMKESGDRLAETGKTDYDNKLSLWLDKFDIHQDNGRDVKTTQYGKSNASRIFNSHLLYAGLTIGEDLLASTTALAYARKVKLRGPNGEPANLWDAYEVKYVKGSKETKDGSGAYLQLKEGYTKEDGSAFTFEDEKKFSKKVIATNFALQGIYNVDDRSAIQQHSLGALAIMYRKWIAPAMKRRYGRAKYNKLRDEETEGYYNTFNRLVKETVKDWFTPVSEEESERTVLQIMTDIRALKNAAALNWSKMNDYERGNVRKAFSELAIVFCLMAASGLLKNLPPDDHDGDKFLAWADDIALTQLLRLRSEIGSQAPTPMLVTEFGRILSSPFAAMRPLVDSLNVFQLLWPSNYFEEIKSGRYKGHTKAHKYFMKLPVVSLFRKFDNVIDPSSVLSYYKNQNYL